MARTLQRRVRAAASLLTVLLVACVAPRQAVALPSDAPVLTPARSLGLDLSDLPGFQLRDELSPVLSATGPDDPWGRLGSYSATFSPAAGADSAEVVSSINTYAGAAHARGAFNAWRSAIPRQYRPSTLPLALAEEDSAAFVRDGVVLVGYRVRNVLGSLRAPERDADRLVRVMIARSIAPHQPNDKR